MRPQPDVDTVDIDQARVVFATEGKDAATVAAFANDLTAHGSDPDAIAEVCIDMSPGFIRGIADSLPKAVVTFDKFHAVKAKARGYRSMRNLNAMVYLLAGKLDINPAA